MHLLTPTEARDLWPTMDISDLVGAAFLPTDGQTNPSDTAQALANGARQAGIRIIEDCPVTAIRIKDGRAAGVATGEGDIACEIVVNCAGQWAREVGALAGVNVPLASMQHQYIITEPYPRRAQGPADAARSRPAIYFKEEVGGLVMGGYEPDPIPWAETASPRVSTSPCWIPTGGISASCMEQALARVPALRDRRDQAAAERAGELYAGWLVHPGRGAGAAGFYVGAGFNAYGIAGAGGAGRALAEWIVGGEAPMDLSAVDILRFGHAAQRYRLCARAHGRGLRQTLHHGLAA